MHLLNSKSDSHVNVPFCWLKAVFTLAKFSKIMPATATSNSHHCSCLGHLGRCDTNGIVSTSCCVAQGGQGKYCFMSLTPMVSITNSLRIFKCKSQVQGFFKIRLGIALLAHKGTFKQSHILHVLIKNETFIWSFLVHFSQPMKMFPSILGPYQNCTFAKAWKRKRKDLLSRPTLS